MFQFFCQVYQRLEEDSAVTFTVHEGDNTGGSRMSENAARSLLLDTQLDYIFLLPLQYNIPTWN